MSRHSDKPAVGRLAVLRLLLTQSDSSFARVAGFGIETGAGMALELAGCFAQKAETDDLAELYEAGETHSWMRRRRNGL